MAGRPPLTQRDIARFYYPLALTSMISLVTGPLLTFFMGREPSPIESLAVLPVVQSLVFLFRSGGVAFQEVGVALSGRRHEHEREVGRASRLLASVATLALAVVLFTPLADGLAAARLGTVAGACRIRADARAAAAAAAGDGVPGSRSSAPASS